MSTRIRVKQCDGGSVDPSGQVRLKAWRFTCSRCGYGPMAIGYLFQRYPNAADAADAGRRHLENHWDRKSNYALAGPSKG